MKYFFILLALPLMFLTSCGEDDPQPVAPPVKKEKPPVVVEFGYVLDDYIVIRDTVQSGDSFGQLLYDNGIDYGTIQTITDSIKDIFDTRKIDKGKPYLLLKSKDSLQQAKVFIYQENSIDYKVVDFSNTIIATSNQRPVTIIEKVVYGSISDNLSTTFDDLGLSVNVAYKMADIYAWTIDFFRLQPGDQFKLVYTEKYINDSIPAGFGEIKASWFEHKGKPIYAFRYQDSITGKYDYYDQDANNLKRAFLKGPLSFNRISSRYNLKRRIAFYGNKIRPHKGTDFAGAVGTPIMSTASGTVEKSEYRGGNGNYVKVRHNKTYETQYLHMSKRAVKVGQYVNQGQVIGYIGMTGNTSGPHVCYRFWKNGKQIDPFSIDLTASQPMEDSLKPKYFNFIEPLKLELDNVNPASI